MIHHKRLGTWLPVGGEMEAGELPLEAARRELREETGLEGLFPAIRGAFDGVPEGFLGYEEHSAGSKGTHMNFVFLAEVKEAEEVVSNHEFDQFRWVESSALKKLDAPKNVVEFGLMALSSEVV